MIPGLLAYSFNTGECDEEVGWAPVVSSLGGEQRKACLAMKVITVPETKARLSSFPAMPFWGSSECSPGEAWLAHGRNQENISGSKVPTASPAWGKMGKRFKTTGCAAS